jgi:N-acetylglucosaminyldiphosphoundecaprenol N-acetyl-beta-D-mannosaminyltransferase
LWTEERKRPPAYIVQTNVFTLVTAAEISTYGEVLDHADYSLPDGMPLIWLLNLKGHTLKERIYGPDMMLRLCEEAEKAGWRCFLYGGKEETLRKLRESLIRRFPSMKIVGSYSPPFRAVTKEEDEEICRIINAAKPDIVWVGLGAPKQDIWMYEHKDLLDVSVLHGVGAAFDFLSGQIPQAPRWMMQIGLEWLFRLLIEPKRLWKRYTITNIKFLFYLCSSAVRHKNDNVK